MCSSRNMLSLFLFSFTYVLLGMRCCYFIRIRLSRHILEIGSTFRNFNWSCGFKCMLLLRLMFCLSVFLFDRLGFFGFVFGMLSGNRFIGLFSYRRYRSFAEGFSFEFGSCL
ncbi:hypothetical protein BDQ17DRAFT_1342670 [Cyathus striatus]|nr:hypothetical protein BDQ17DRAFT_1381622 [Cyathus striatus]KAF9013068.1 hypothetical protein BDQ17DRAFT_1342670 [Cyathus striatus]